MAKKFEQILIRSVNKNNQADDYALSSFFEALEIIEQALQKSPANVDLVSGYRKQIVIIRSLLISALIEALDNLDRKIENLDGINALLESIAAARRIQTKRELIAVVNLVIENFDQYGIGCDK